MKRLMSYGGGGNNRAMSIIRRWGFICCFFVFLTSNIYADTRVTEASPPAAHDPVAENLKIISKLEAQVANLKLQNQLIQNYQDKMSSVVYWALGVVAGIFALLMSYSVFTNFRFYEQDKERLKKELQSVIDIFKSDLGVKFEQDRGDLERAFDLRNESNIKIILEQGTEVRAKIDSVRAEFIEGLDSTKKEQSTLSEKLDHSKKTMQTFATQFFAVEEMVWDLKGIPECILITQSQAIDAALEADNVYFVTSTLKRLGETLKKHYIEGDDVLDPSDLGVIEEMLGKAATKDGQSVRAVRQKLKDCRRDDK